MSNFTIKVGAKVDTNQINSQLKGYKPTITVKTALEGGGSREVTTYTNALNKTLKVEKKLDSQGNVTSNTIKRISTNAQNASTKVGQLGKDFLVTTGKVAKFYASAMVIQGFTSAINEAVTTVKEFDDAITDFKKVSDLSGDSLDKYNKKLGELGLTVGRTRTEMVQNATKMKQAGYSDEDSAKLATLASKYQNVADSEISASEASAFLVSQMKAYNLNADQATTILDQLNEVSNNYSVSSSDIATGLTKSASALANLGNSSAETIGLLTAGTEQLTGQASKVGKGLQSIGINLANTAKKSKTLDIAVGDSTKTIQLYSKKTGDMLSTFDILKQISKYWDDMTYKQKVNLATAQAGKTRYDVYSAVMNKFSDAVSASETALNSAGSADRENERYMESLGAKIQELKAQFQELVLGDGGLNKMAKNLVDLGIKILKFANSDIGQATIKFVLFSVAIGGGIKALGLLSGKVLGLMDTLSALKGAEGIVGVIKAFSTLGTTATATGTAIEGSAVLGTASIGGLVSAFAPFLVGGAIAIGLGVLINKLTDVGDKASKAQDKIDKLDSDTSKKKQEKQELQDEYDKLEKKGKNLTEYEKARKKYLEDELKIIKEQIDANNKQEAEAKKDYNKYNLADTKDKFKYKDNRLDVKGDYGLSVANSYAERLQRQYKTGNISVGEYIDKNTKLIKSFRDLSGVYATQIKNGNKLEDVDKRQIDTIADLAKRTVEAGGNVKDLNEDTLTLIASSSKSINKNGKLNKSTKDLILQYYNLKKGTKEAKEKIAEYQEIASKRIDGKKSTKSVKKGLDDVKKSANKTKDSLKGVKRQSEKEIIVKNFNTLKNALKKVSDKGKEAINKLSGTKKAINDLPNKKNVSISVVMSVIKKIKSFFVKDEKANGGEAKGGTTLVGEEGTELVQSGDGAYLVGENGAEITELKKGDYVYTAKETKSILGGKSIKNKIGSRKNGTKKSSDKLDKLKERVKSHIEERLDNIDTISGYTKHNLKTLLAYINKERKLNRITAQEKIDYLNQYYNIKASSYLDDYDKDIKSYSKTKKLLYNYVKSGKIKWSEYHKYIDELNEKSVEKLKDSLDKKIDALDKLVEQQEAQQSLLQIYAEEQQDIIQKQIDALDEENDAYEKQVEYEELLANLQKAKSNRVKVYKKGEGFIYAEDTESVKEAQKAIDDFNRSQALENQKKALEEQRNAWSDFIDEMSDVQQKWELEQKAGVTYEKLIQDSKITNLETFITKYKELATKLQEEQEKIAKIQAQEENNERIKNTYKYTYADSKGNLHGSNISQKRAKGIAEGTITKLIPVKRSAVGSYGIKEDGATLVGDNPNYQELVIGSKLNDGSQIMNLQKGTGVIPNNLTSTLVRMASSYNNQNYKQSLANGQTLINTGNWVFPNITNSSSAENLFSEIKRLAIQESYKRG